MHDAAATDRAPEDVREYPRPPRVEAITDRVRIWLGDDVIVDTTDVVRVLETWHPPTIYVPRAAFAPTCIAGSAHRSTMCEWKGAAQYVDLLGSDGTAYLAAGWSYAEPRPGFEALAGRVAIYPGRVSRAELAGERVEPQPGDFYGGWKTSWINGPIKGGPGTWGW
ncbi:MAG: hypothetical protein JWM86_2016 [Thermoleophilia bacterium]|nr:hypothetical protein [Thermoleophilia bacterium]